MVKVVRRKIFLKIYIIFKKSKKIEKKIEIKLNLEFDLNFLFI